MASFGRGTAALLSAVGLLAGVVGSLAVVASSPAVAAGTIVFDGSPGTNASPSTLGPYTMTPFSADGRPEFDQVSDVPAPTGGSVTFDGQLEHLLVPTGWNNWSNGYNSDVYCSDCPTNGHPSSITMTLPANTVAFYFYAEADAFNTFDFTATAQDGTTSGSVSVTTPDGAKYFGFYTTDPNNPIVTVTTSNSATDNGFAVGEFGIAMQVPTPPAPAEVALTARFTG